MSGAAGGGGGGGGGGAACYIGRAPPIIPLTSITLVKILIALSSIGSTYLRIAILLSMS